MAPEAISVPCEVGGHRLHWLYLNELPGLPVAQGHNFSTFPAQLQHRAIGVGGLRGRGSTEVKWMEPRMTLIIVCAVSGAWGEKGIGLQALSWPLCTRTAKTELPISLLELTRPAIHRATDGAGSKQIPRLHVAASGSVVGQLLLHRPIQVFHV